jgi:hypothetical protein
MAMKYWFNDSKSNSSIFQLQENKTRALEKELSKATEEFNSQVQLLKEKISKLTSEKV